MASASNPVLKLAVGLVLSLALVVARTQQVEVQWLGHSTFKFTSVSGKVIVIDPFLKKNSRVPAKFKDLAALGKVDLILVTHGHHDHIADLPELAAMNDSAVVASFELINNLVAVKLLDGKKRVVAMNKGGTVSPLGPGIKIHMVNAEHSSSADILSMKPDYTGPRYLDGGAAVGHVIEFESGFTTSMTGDTDAFGDMALIGRFFKPDLALVCIGGHFTMDPDRAAWGDARTRAPQDGHSDALRHTTGHSSDPSRVQSGARGRADQDARSETR
jgi:L-ascorbate metabolism protein UlaG (beta-lactamase superfamily)